MVEDHFLEKNERSGVAFCLHPQERTLPAIQNEVSSRVRVQSRSDVPLNLRLRQARPDGILNSTKDLFEPGLKRVIEHAHFLGEVSYWASHFAFILLVLDASFLEKSLKSLDMPYFRGLQDRLPSRSQSFGIVVDQRQPQVFLALEIKIERSLWDSGAFEDFLDTRIVEAFLVNDLCGVLKYFVFGAIFSHGLSSFPAAIVDRSSSSVKFFLQPRRMFEVKEFEVDYSGGNAAYGRGMKMAGTAGPTDGTLIRIRDLTWNIGTKNHGPAMQVRGATSPSSGGEFWVPLTWEPGQSWSQFQVVGRAVPAIRSRHPHVLKIAARLIMMMSRLVSVGQSRAYAGFQPP